MAKHNIDLQEVAKFEAMAHRWWDPEETSARSTT